MLVLTTTNYCLPGGDVNITDEDGDTPLYTVETIETARWLIEHGARYDHVNAEGLTVCPSPFLMPFQSTDTRDSIASPRPGRRIPRSRILPYLPRLASPPNHKHEHLRTEPEPAPDLRVPCGAGGRGADQHAALVRQRGDDARRGGGDGPRSRVARAGRADRRAGHDDWAWVGGRAARESDRGEWRGG